MANGNKMLKDMKPRAPTTGLIPSSALSGTRNIPFSRAGLGPRGSSARRLAAETITQGPSQPPPSIGTGRIASPTIRAGMVRRRREAPRMQRTQFVGGRPSAVRVSYNPFDFMSDGSGVSPNINRPGTEAPSKFAELENLVEPGSYAKGGDVDTVPAWLQPGEFVIDKAHTQQIKKAKGGELEKAIDGIIEDIKLGRRPGDRPVEGRTDFTDGGTVTKDMEPGYQLGGDVEDKEPVRKMVKSGEVDRHFLDPRRLGGGSTRTIYRDAEGGRLDNDEEARALQSIYDAQYNQEVRERAQMKREREASEEAKRQQARSLEAMRAASRRGVGLAKERGAELQRRAGEVAAKEQRANTAQAARMALSRASVQPVEASLSTASQLQLRSALQGAIIRSQAELEAQRMSLAAEMQQVQDEIRISGREFELAANNEAREFALSRQREAQNRQAYLAQQSALLNMRLQKAQQPGFWESLVPGLIQGAFTVAGAYFGGPIGGMIGNRVGAAATSAYTPSATAANNYSAFAEQQAYGSLGRSPSMFYSGSTPAEAEAAAALYNQ